MARCGHLSIEEREGVTLLARQHKGVREIARTIGRDKSTVSRELARNSSAAGDTPYYRASTAQRKYERRRSAGAPRDPRLLLRAPPPLGEGHQREHQRVTRSVFCS